MTEPLPPIVHKGEFSIVAVGWRKGQDPHMPSPDEVTDMLKRLWAIDSQPDEVDFKWDPWVPKGEFKGRKRAPIDRKFRASNFKRGKKREDDGCLGTGGLDALGTYRLCDSMVTIYVDSCRRAARQYAVSLKGLITTVLIHELTHLMTHKGFETSEDAENHFWEYTAQCGTYAYLKQRGDREGLKAFEQLSLDQPFIYRTWEGLKHLEGVKSRKEVIGIVKKIFHASIPKAPPTAATYDDFSEYDD
jgi:hypothetical protein